MEEGEVKTEYILDKENQRKRDEMLALLDKPLLIQRYAYFTYNTQKFYKATVIVEKDDRISVIYKKFMLRMGNNGIFIKQKPEVRGATYYKKGRSSKRFTLWGGGSYALNIDDEYLIRSVVERVNPDALELLDHEILRGIATQGMYGSIIAGKIKNITDAITYFIRYSMRGTGIDVSNNMHMAMYLNSIRDIHLAKMVLRVAKDPNELLKQFTLSGAPEIKLNIETHGRNLVQLALCTSEKIDWVNPELDCEAEAKRLTKKVRRIEDLLQLWEGGPVLKVKASTQLKIELPF